MRISDWSSDVCSSDLGGRKRGVERRDRLTVGIEFGGDGGKVEGRIGACEIGVDARFESLPRREPLAALGHFRPQVAVGRSEGRRDGKECVSTCIYRWAPDH